MIFEEHEKLRAALTSAYDATAQDAKTIVQLASVFYHFVDRKKLIVALNSVMHALPPGARSSPKAFDSILKHLASSGLLERSERSGYRCMTLLMEHASRDAVRLGLFPELARAVRAARYEYWENDGEGKMRELRIALYLNESQDRIFNLLSELNRYHHQRFQERHPLVIIFNNPFDPGSVAALPPDLQLNILFCIFMHAAFRLAPVSDVEAFARAFLETPREGDEHARFSFAQYLLLRGKAEEAEKLLSVSGREAGSEAVRAWLLFLRGDDEKAVELYESALKLLRKAAGKQRVYFRGLYGAWYPLLLIASREPVRVRKALSLIGQTDRFSGGYADDYGDLAEILACLKTIALLTELEDNTSRLERGLIPGHHFTMINFFRLTEAYFLSPSTLGKVKVGARDFFEQTERQGFTLISAELNELLSRVNGDGPKGTGKAASFREKTGFRSIFSLMTPEEPWQRALNALKQVGTETRPEAFQSEKRLVWLFQYYPEGTCGLQPLEQKLSVKGVWSKGRSVSIKDPYVARNRRDYLTAQDKRAIDLFYDGQYRWGEEDSSMLQVLTELIGHPLLFLAEAPGVRVELVKGNPEVLVTRGRKNITITLHPPLAGDIHAALLRETPTRFRIVELTPKHKELVRIIGEKLSVPLSAADAVLEALSSLSSFVQIQSDIGGNLENIKELPSDPKPHFVMMPFGEGLNIQVRTRLLAVKGPYYSPGKGGETVILEIDGEKALIQRSLKQELKLAEEAIQACPALGEREDIDGEWRIDEPEACLELLTSLQALGENVVVDWPEGAKFKIARQASLSSFHVSINRENDWFGLNGELRLNEDKVMELRQLLELLGSTPGRFVSLGNNEFLALTKDLRKRLDDLARFTEPHGQGFRFHPLAAPAIEELTEGTELTTDRAWQERIDRMRQAQALEPVVPSTFAAELRDYQKDGYAWLARLAHWGVGACLADDMGLGKTVQALALIVSRAAKGPSLVAAPTSVCMNWLEEARKFAPTLKPIQFGPGDRKETIASLRPFDLLICSYGLIQQEEELLSSLVWETVVLDEAQAIKNAATKRSQSAMKLKAEFKVITTGTPVENHLDELWNLFRFINPGLLGSLDSFNTKYANPIERYSDHAARGRLKRLVQPFILRRLKTQVLAELPQKTEIALQVELGEEETALYEAMRRQSLDRIAGASGNAGQKSIQILAEITRLRRLCCNPRLVHPSVKTKGAKLELFGEVLEELLENNHKALVFSQFVDHLAILRGYLDERKIAYQYLDGSTTQKERKRSVDAFQNGEGAVFLISLKAGGLGLNLTAADYVIHMDPWWNPAVEDQASDRVYRIGQERPVTIYRLITKGTIEEKIVDLHKHKRALADSLLEGSDMSGRISPDDLLRLLTEPAGE